ncbi:Pre-mRNA-splicing factor 3 [Suillus paluster]|uniref:Pre-mRNA-splicing factor 3 n=1 Tax=Suillus paluster TaxID=48578 RepID=UPI001B88605E|nr:Pre-mRNA-splicing factor 3 [Suillus paluster]KAG1735635.1 Pre-mRNA-splicing factor 3 [Suillus paluster]
MRKQRRQADREDERDRIRDRMGLIPADPPKVHLSNLMKVLTSDAVQDPTRIEARVRKEKENKKSEEEKKGIVGLPSHRFKVPKNAEQRNSTGVCIFNPAFSMVYVEGTGRLDVVIDNGGKDDNEAHSSSGAGDSGSADGNRAAKAQDETASLRYNACYLVWQGQLRDRAFNMFMPRGCPTGAMAREALGQKLAGYWDQAKNWKPEEELC